ncbi:MAG: carboxypeptidase-like regulatory domain-containing protein, partial [Planctomycetota bacterium]
MLRWLAALGLVVLALGAWLVVRRASVERGLAQEEPRGVTVVAEAPLAPVQVTAAERAPVEGEHPESAADTEDEAEDEDPPTPERPGPAQALLRVRAVALESGAALAGLYLDLVPLDEEDEEHEWRSSTQSDPARGLENDALVTRADGSAEFIVEAGFGYRLRGHGENGVADWNELDVGSLSSGEERAITFALPTRWTRLWEGRVVDAASEVPLVGAEVRVVVDSSGGSVEEEVTLAQGSSGSDGRVRLVLPAWQSAKALCRMSGYAFESVHVREESEGNEPQLLPLHRYAALTVVVHERDGQPASGIELNLRRVPGPSIGLRSGEQVTNPSGEVEVRELPSGVDLSASLYRDGEWLGRAEALEKYFVLAPGEHRRIEVHLPGAGKIAGRLLDPQGKPLADVPVQVVVLGGWTERSPVLPYLQETLHGVESLTGNAASGDADATSDAEGLFEVSRPIGAYHVGASSDSDVPALGKVVVVREGETASLELVLERGLWIEGKVLDPRGAPAWGVGLSCNGEGDSRQFRRASCATEEDGSFSLGPLLSGPYRLRSRAGEGERDAPIEELVVDAGTRGLELTLRLGGTIQVEFEGLAEDEEAEVFVRSESAPWSGGFEQLPPGRYDLHAYSDKGRVSVLRGFVVEAGRDHRVTLPLTPGATLHLTEPGAESEISSFRV